MPTQAKGCGGYAVSIAGTSDSVLHLKEHAAFPNATSIEVKGLEEWMKTFWLESQLRKYPGMHLLLKNGEIQMDNLHALPNMDIGSFQKRVSLALKKIVVEDLGDLDAIQLLALIPETDKHGRGKEDLERIQKDLSVKVVFLEENKHVLLVGPKQKLTKKCFVLKNLLSHYHWRLSGKMVSL